MIIRRDQHITDSEANIVECGFHFSRYDKYGVQKYLDDIGNAVFVNRDGVIVTIYSKEHGMEVDDLSVTKMACRRWPTFDQDENDAGNASRREKLAVAWDTLLASLPQPKEVSTELLQAVTNARSGLEYCVLYSHPSDVLEEPDLLAEAQDAIDEIKSICPEARVSALLMLIVSADNHLHS